MNELRRNNTWRTTGAWGLTSAKFLFTQTLRGGREPAPAAAQSGWKSALLCAQTLCLLASVLCPSATAQYSIDWSTIDGGGGTSTGGVYTVSGAIGQPDAGTMSGGNFTLVGGFWGVVAALQTPGAPYLTVARSNATVLISWPTPANGWVLVSTSNLASAPQTNIWTQVPFPYQTNSTTISATEPAPVERKFYRLWKP